MAPDQTKIELYLNRRVHTERAASRGKCRAKQLEAHALAAAMPKARHVFRTELLD